MIEFYTLSSIGNVDSRFRGNDGMEAGMTEWRRELMEAGIAKMAGGSDGRLQSVLTYIELELVVIASDDHLSSFP